MRGRRPYRRCLKSSRRRGSAGVAVHLCEAESTCLTQASRNNEGEVHLGYVYANDPTLATARLMIDGALSFEPLLRRLDVAVDEIAVSAPGSTWSLVRACSTLTCRPAIAWRLAGQPAYFGSDLRMAPHRIPLDAYDERAVTAASRTPEIAVDPRSLCAVLRRRVMEDPRIEVRLSTPVESVRRGRRGLLVDSAVGAEEYDHVVNAAWAGPEAGRCLRRTGRDGPGRARAAADGFPGPRPLASARCRQCFGPERARARLLVRGSASGRGRASSRPAATRAGRAGRRGPQTAAGPTMKDRR